MKKNTIFHFLKIPKKKKSQKIYIIDSDIFFIFHFILFFNYKRKQKLDICLAKKLGLYYTSYFNGKQIFKA
jgi:hypothetical protein